MGPVTFVAAIRRVAYAVAIVDPRVRGVTVLLAYYLLVPFAIGGLFVMRHRHLPVFSMFAIAVSVTITVAVGFPVTHHRAPFDVLSPRSIEHVEP